MGKINYLYTEHPKKSHSCFGGIQINDKMTIATKNSDANEVNLQQNDLSINDADQLQTKIDDLLGEIDVEKMLNEVQLAMQPLQDKITEMSNSIFSRVDEMGRKIGELESKIMEVVNEATGQPESVITTVSSDIPAVQS